MPIVAKQKVIVLDGHCEIDAAEELEQWLVSHPKGQVNAKKLVSAHTAVLQVLIYHRPAFSVWPEAGNWQWLRQAMTNGAEA